LVRNATTGQDENPPDSRLVHGAKKRVVFVVFVRNPLVYSYIMSNFPKIIPTTGITGSGF
jgi:hypothetical protein